MTLSHAGCDSGFGRLLARRLDALGCTTIASCLTHTAVCELRNQLSNRALVIKLDVTNASDVDAAISKTKQFVPEHKGDALASL